ncbi:MAG: UMP kinase [Candidatus Coatesbacteria bacterium]|nr:MAG: UMP kinase [Candidatus Coatesbacteria bacterium]
MSVRYKRALLKLSGGALTGGRDVSLDPDTLEYIADEILGAVAEGLDLGVVIGGGNHFRGRQAGEWKLDRVTVDYMGMLGTAMNGLALADALVKKGAAPFVMSSFPMGEICAPYDRRRALKHIEKSVVIFIGGTGRPFFTTDTTAALRACEIGAEVLLKATDVDGIFDADPDGNPDAKLIPEISYVDVVKCNLPVMDATAAAMCMQNQLPLIIYNGTVPGNLYKIVNGERIGTLVG